MEDKATVPESGTPRGESPGHDHGDHGDHGGHGVADSHHGHCHLRGEITTKAALVSVFSNMFLAVCKLWIGWRMGSAAVLSEGLHSATDLLASFSAYFSVRISSRPADEVHPFGHGKFEDLSAVFEASLIIVIAGAVVWKAVSDFLAGTCPQELELGIGIMVLSIVLNSVVARFLHNTARQQDSLALAADAWHLSADVYTSLGVLGGLILVAMTGQRVFDPLAALGVGIYIVGEAIHIGKKGLQNLLDVRLPSEEIALIEAVLEAHASATVRFHALRTRKAGPERHIDLHAVVDGELPAHTVQDLCHQIEDEIRLKLPGSRILMRLEIDGHERACPPSGGDRPDRSTS